MQKFALHQIERQYTTGPTVLDLNVFTAFLLDHHVGVHRPHSVESLGLQYFQIDGNTIPYVIKRLICVIGIDQRVAGKHLIQHLADAYFLRERIHTSKIFNQSGAQDRWQLRDGTLICFNK